MDGGDKKNLWIIANWKSNKTIEEALDWISIVGPQIPKRNFLKVVVCPEFVAIEEVQKTARVGNFPLMVGSQDLSPFPEGAHTGEEAAKDLTGLVSLSILGHSERRKNFGETDQMVAEKVLQASSSGIIPLVCVQDEGTNVPEGCKLIAYEPIFAIGTGHPDSPESANDVAKKFKQKYGESLEVLYGGSVTSENCKKFVSMDSLSGLLIGGASLLAEEFIKIVNECAGF